jgi:hypothetical protein
MHPAKSFRTMARSWNALACLIAYLLGVAPLASEFAYLAAYLDGSHQVLIETGGAEIHLTLRHHSTAVAVQGRSRSDRHTATAAVLCGLWGSMTSSFDHHLEFVNSGPVERAAASKLSISSPRVTGATALIPIDCPKREPVIWRSDACPSPLVPNSILSTRVTVLLI